jgi:hypothetical protein
MNYTITHYNVGYIVSESGDIVKCDGSYFGENDQIPYISQEHLKIARERKRKHLKKMKGWNEN